MWEGALISENVGSPCHVSLLPLPYFQHHSFYCLELTCLFGLLASARPEI